MKAKQEADIRRKLRELADEGTGTSWDSEFAADVLELIESLDKESALSYYEGKSHGHIEMAELLAKREGA